MASNFSASSGDTIPDRLMVEPRMWCGYTSDKSWVYREWEVEYNPLDKLIAELKRRGEELYLWYSFHSEEEFMERADKLRFIFWFDN